MPERSLTLPVYLVVVKSKAIFQDTAINFNKKKFFLRGRKDIKFTVNNFASSKT